MITLSIVIPAYNEETGIEEIIRRVLKIRKDLDAIRVHFIELLVVDDGSSDRTVNIIENYSKKDDRIRLIRHHSNLGYGAALKTGFSQAQGELIGFLDADGTYPPEYFPQLCRSAINGYDLVIGSRMSGAESKMPFTRRVGNLFFARLLTMLSGEKITDSASGMRVFHRKVLEKVYPLPDSLNLTPVMSARAVHEGVRIAEIPIPYDERIGRSKLSVVRDGSIFLSSIIWTVLSYNPVSVLGIFGLGGIIYTFFVGIGFVIARLLGVTSLGPWGVVALFTALVSAVTGISILALGLTFNYLVSLFNNKEVSRGLLTRYLFGKSLDHNFGWMGLIGLILGLGVAITSMVLGIRGWDVSRLWFYLLGSAVFILFGVQLMIYWILMRVLEALSHRKSIIEQELNIVE